MGSASGTYNVEFVMELKLKKAFNYYRKKASRDRKH
jgi:hypothetical protein